MGTFQKLESCRRLSYVAVRRLSLERHNAIPDSLWPPHPWYGTQRHHRRPRPHPDLTALQKQLRHSTSASYIH
jgi:hypothetical protein